MFAALASFTFVGAAVAAVVSGGNVGSVGVVGGVAGRGIAVSVRGEDSQPPQGSSDPICMSILL